jgi:hypothetical protein
LWICEFRFGAPEFFLEIYDWCLKSKNKTIKRARKKRIGKRRKGKERKGKQTKGKERKGKRKGYWWITQVPCGRENWEIP